jgi:hypothetical protein
MVTECWNSLDSPTMPTLCTSCFIDDSRKFAKLSIDKLISMRKTFENYKIKLTNYTNLLKNNNQPNMTEVNTTLAFSIIFVKKNYDLILSEIDVEFLQQMNQTQIKIKEANDKAKSEKNKKLLQSYYDYSNYYQAILKIALLEYKKEKSVTYSVGELLLTQTDRLEKLLFHQRRSFDL